MNDSGSTTTNRNRESLTITVTGPDDATILRNALRQVFQHTDSMAGDDDHGDSEIVGFRATGDATPALLAATIQAALDEAEAQRVTVRAVDIAGVMLVDEGMRCWGYLSTQDRVTARPTVAVVGMPVIAKEDDHLHAEFVIQIDRP